MLMYALARQFKSKPTRFIFFGVASIAKIHFGISVSVWLIALVSALKQGHVDWAYVLSHAMPSFFLFAAFMVSCLLAWKSRVLAVPITVISLIAAVICFRYDATHLNYQVQMMELDKGCTHLYFTWWWYDDRGSPNH